MVTFAEISLLNATLSSLSLSGMFKSSWYCKDSCVHHIYGFINLHAFLSFCIWNESGKLWPVSDCHLNHVHWICAKRLKKPWVPTANLDSSPLFVFALNKLGNSNNVCRYIHSRLILDLWPGEEKQKWSHSLIPARIPPLVETLSVKGEYVLSTGMSWSNPRDQTV